MSKAPTVVHKRPKKTCVIDAYAMYSTSALGLVGIGRKLVSQMREDGLKPFVVGNNRFYDGAEVIDWIKKHKQRAQ